jgi:hypothetical protein
MVQSSAACDQLHSRLCVLGMISSNHSMGVFGVCNLRYAHDADLEHQRGEVVEF